MIRLSPYYKKLLLDYGWEGNFDAFGPSAKNKIRPVYKRIVNNPFCPDPDNGFELRNFIEHILNDEFLNSPETFGWYVYDRYRAYSKDFDGKVGVRWEELCEDDFVRNHKEDIKRFLLGLSARYPEYLNFSPTHDLNYLVIRFSGWRK